MTPDSKKIMNDLRALKPRLKGWGITRLRVFGSVLHGEAGPKSDVDLIADFDVIPGFGFFRIEQEMEELLGRKVDLTLGDSIHPIIRQKVLREARDV